MVSFGIFSSFLSLVLVYTVESRAFENVKKSLTAHNSYLCNTYPSLCPTYMENYFQETNRKKNEQADWFMEGDDQLGAQEKKTLFPSSITLCDYEPKLCESEIYYQHYPNLFEKKKKEGKNNSNGEELDNSNDDKARNTRRSVCFGMCKDYLLHVVPGCVNSCLNRMK